MKTEALKELVAGLDLQTDLWWLAMILSGFLATFLAAFGFRDSGAFFVWLAVLVRLAVAVGISQQPFGAVFGRLLPFGLVAGVFALFGDHMLVNWSGGGQRIYPDRTGVLLSSPIYIPLFWACTILEFGYMIVRIWGLLASLVPGEAAMGATMVMGGFIAAIWTACMDFWAVRAGWWSYAPGKVILGGACALYVVIASFFIHCMLLPLLVRYLSCSGSRVYASIRYGGIFGGVIYLSYVAALVLVEHRI
jgi:hypothetical protein